MASCAIWETSYARLRTRRAEYRDFRNSSDELVPAARAVAVERNPRGLQHAKVGNGRCPSCSGSISSAPKGANKDSSYAGEGPDPNRQLPLSRLSLPSRRRIELDLQQRS